MGQLFVYNKASISLTIVYDIYSHCIPAFYLDYTTVLQWYMQVPIHI